MLLVNGSLDGVVLLVQVAGVSGARLRPGSAQRWAAIRAGVEDEFGWSPEVVSAGDGYRDVKRQRRLFERNYTTTNTGHGPSKVVDGTTFWRRTAGTPSAAVPGKSNHGLGTTVDVVDVGQLKQFNPTTTRYNQFAAVAARHSFSNAEGRSIGEPWHWSDTADPDDGIAVQFLPEADMPLNQADLEAIDRLIVGRVTTVVDQLLTLHQASTVLTQADKEAVDKLIIDRLAEGLGPLSRAVGEIHASLGPVPFPPD
ncbi:M15 family metallopeptidase [uncultured Cellulomonas sp.]|uniref:M15 family metallopeptidase n=1 Tax=uncultured Cellulomonas sp. TaxID=189682 RepID=UPI0028EDE339|nr:M15 family metallopeptidase [uncultured Cellulomonas sp.]